MLYICNSKKYKRLKPTTKRLIHTISITSGSGVRRRQYKQHLQAQRIQHITKASRRRHINETTTNATLTRKNRKKPSRSLKNEPVHQRKVEGLTFVRRDPREPYQFMSARTLWAWKRCGALLQQKSISTLVAHKCFPPRNPPDIILEYFFGAQRFCVPRYPEIYFCVPG